MQNIKNIINSGKTIFSIMDLKNILQIPTLSGINSFLMRAKKNGIIINVQNGLWRLERYDTEELACKLKTRSYISLETILTKSGIIFQNYDNIITAISDNSKTIEINGQIFRYSKIKNEILYDTTGIELCPNKMIASPERAFCDLIYLRPDVDIENIQGLNYHKLENIASIYPSKVILHIQKLIQNAR